MTDPTPEQTPPGVRDPEAAYGGADAIEKTTYVVGEGTDPHRQHPMDRPSPVGQTGMNPLLWAVVIVAVVIAVVLMFGIIRT